MEEYLFWYSPNRDEGSLKADLRKSISRFIEKYEKGLPNTVYTNMPELLELGSFSHEGATVSIQQSKVLDGHFAMCLENTNNVKT